MFQCSSASRKFLKLRSTSTRSASTPRVSVLFSEPKIPQMFLRGEGAISPKGFSALQRAENSSNYSRRTVLSVEIRVSVLFSEPKIPQPHDPVLAARWAYVSSALQRAENSSTPMLAFAHPDAAQVGSALQRAENSSTPLNTAM